MALEKRPPWLQPGGLRKQRKNLPSSPTKIAIAIGGVTNTTLFSEKVGANAVDLAGVATDTPILMAMTAVLHD
ncbi:hypothetical protein Nepgr_031712 [Nepenthes gracilis]|uniref:Uncharacterized protein n=1 Tax=Nepenthes gracilis TaxID=150966 RepID=A0AAD3TIS8_NEPGR|nr:hypothetical protein Nepgr_031712 [Nepenthes gracilis]